MECGGVILTTWPSAPQPCVDDHRSWRYVYVRNSSTVKLNKKSNLKYSLCGYHASWRLFFSILPWNYCLCPHNGCLLKKFNCRCETTPGQSRGPGLGRTWHRTSRQRKPETRRARKRERKQGQRQRRQPGKQGRCTTWNTTTHRHTAGI